MTGPFYLQMADHVAHPVLRPARPCRRTRRRQGRLLVDYHPVNLDEADATKVQVSNGLISAIGEDIYPYDAVDTGCFRLEPRIFEALNDVAKTEAPSVTLGMRHLLANGLLSAVPLVGVRWTNVDAPRTTPRPSSCSARRPSPGESRVTAVA